MKITTFIISCLLVVTVSFAGQSKSKQKSNTKTPAVNTQPQQPNDLQTVRPGARLDTIRVNSFTPLEMKQVIDHYGSGKELLLIDVSSAEDFATGHVKGAINIPFEQFEKQVQTLRKEKNRNIVIVCKDGKRSMTACGILVANKFEWVWYLKKGLEAWTAANYPIEK